MKQTEFFYVATRGLDQNVVGHGTTHATTENEALRNAIKKVQGKHADRYFVEPLPAEKLKALL